MEHPLDLVDSYCQLVGKWRAPNGLPITEFPHTEFNVLESLVGMSRHLFHVWHRLWALFGNQLPTAYGLSLESGARVRFHRCLLWIIVGAFRDEICQEKEKRDYLWQCLKLCCDLLTLERGWQRTEAAIIRRRDLGTTVPDSRTTSVASLFATSLREYVDYYWAGEHQWSFSSWLNRDGEPGVLVRDYYNLDQLPGIAPLQVVRVAELYRSFDSASYSLYGGTVKPMPLGSERIWLALNLNSSPCHDDARIRIEIDTVRKAFRDLLTVRERMTRGEWAAQCVSGYVREAYGFWKSFASSQNVTSVDLETAQDHDLCFSIEIPGTAIFEQITNALTWAQSIIRERDHSARH